MFRGGGVQECVLALRAELKKLGHEAYIITPRPRDYEGEEPEGIIFFGGAAQIKTFHTTGQVSAAKSATKVDEILDTYKFDVLHFHEPWVPIVSRQILTRSKALNVATFHARLPDTFMSRTVERVITPYTKSILSYIDVLTAVSDAAAMYVSTLTDRQISIIPNGIDLSLYGKNPNTKTNDNSILYIGRLEKRKGVKYLLKAFFELQKTLPDVRLILAGDGPDKEKLQEYVKEQGILNVEFLGYVTKEKKLELLETAGVFCSPALYGESFGIVLLEAMAKNLPIVAGDNPGYKAVMKERGMLSLVNPRETSGFARKLHVMLTDEAIRKAWRQWAKQYVQKFDYTHVVEQYETVYKSVLKK
jgi:phosphatidylinositol alpha-mannosyltransferase